MQSRRPQSGAELRDALRQIKERIPGIRTRDAARELGVTEAELVACRVGHGVVRLDPDFKAILSGMPAVGEVMVLTRNEHCVHEKHGCFGNVSIGDRGHGLVLNHDVDLRLFLSHWRYGFVVTEEVASGVRTSLQVFDSDGTAVHKIYLTAESDRAAFEALLAPFGAASQSGEIEVVPPPPRRPDRPDDDIDVTGFQEHWRDLQDTHDFFWLLRNFGVSRAQAFRLAERDLAYQVEPTALQRIIGAAAGTRTPIMCFVGNPGCIQIHTGPVEMLKRFGPWFNILDPRFNLHLREDAVHQAWIVRKPTRDGVVTSLELLDAEGFCFVQFFGERKPGKPELSAWREIVAEAPRVEDAGAGA
jgi:putative hemin transport protein